jgi:2-polyprenyl-3-methyl-5-hydroxy-6-metoxy-1,4-benzoquinol methylase
MASSSRDEGQRNVGGVRERWNERHARTSTEGRQTEPATWLVEHRELLGEAAGRRALDIACGRGRNTLWLAELGFDVDAVDISDVAIQTVAATAAQRGLAIAVRRLDLTAEPLPAPPYAVIVVVDYLERSLFPHIEAALEPGGLLLYETYTREHSEMNPKFTLGPNELLQAFPALRVLRYRDTGPRAGLVAISAA